MARSFNGSSDYLRISSTPVTGFPVTIAGWFYATTSGFQRPFTIGNGDTNQDERPLASVLLNYPGAGNVSGQSWDGTTQALPAASGTFTANTWTHAAYVNSASNNHVIYRDGGNSGSDANNPTVPAATDVTVGRVNGSLNAGQYLAGRAADWGVWDVALTADEIAALARGVSARLIRPQSLVGYYPLIGRTSPEIDLRGGRDLTVTGATQAEHPRIYQRSRRRTVFVPAAGGSTYTATAALTTKGATLAGSATFAPGTKTGTSSLTIGHATVAATATFSPGTKTGTGALTTRGATATGTATHVKPTYTGTGSLTTRGLTLAGLGTFSPGTKTGSAALLVRGTTVSASATFSPGTKTGTAAFTTRGPTLAAAATFSPGTKTGVSALAVRGATVAASATTTNPTYTGSSGLTVRHATLSGTAIFAAAVYQATSALTTAHATIAGSATFTPPTYHGTSALTIAHPMVSAAATFTNPAYTSVAVLTASHTAITGTAAYLPGPYTGIAGLTVRGPVASGTARFIPDPFAATPPELMATLYFTGLTLTTLEFNNPSASLEMTWLISTSEIRM